jgi:hypothetical protein
MELEITTLLSRMIKSKQIAQTKTVVSKIKNYKIEISSFVIFWRSSKIKMKIDSLNHEGVEIFTGSTKLDLVINLLQKISLDMDKLHEKCYVDSWCNLAMNLEKVNTLKENKALINQLPLEIWRFYSTCRCRTQQYDLKFKTLQHLLSKFLGVWSQLLVFTNLDNV